MSTKDKEASLMKEAEEEINLEDAPLTNEGGNEDANSDAE